MAEGVIGLSKTEVIKQIGAWKSMRKVAWETLQSGDWGNYGRLLGPIFPTEKSYRPEFRDAGFADHAWSA